MSAIWELNHIENKHNLYRAKDCVKKFYEDSREHAKNAIDFEKEENVNVNERRSKITSKCKSVLHLR